MVAEPFDLYADTWGPELDAEVAAMPGPILVIGASGFIGSKLLFSLARRRRDVYGASKDPLTSWRLVRLPPFLERRQFVDLDITDMDVVRQRLGDLRPRTIFNLSAYGAYERQQNARLIHDVNYVGTLNLLLALQETGCDAFVQAGSSSEYGLNCTNASEQSELVPNSDYAVSKVATSYLLKYAGKIQGFPCAHLRLYSVYGPWEERDRLIPRLVQAGLEGNYPPLAEPTISRDFVYVDDATAAFVRASHTVCRHDPGASINVASGKKTTLADVAGAAREVFSIKEAPVFGSHKNRKWDLSNWYGNPDLARTKLKWTSTLDFKAGLERSAAWEREAGEVLRIAPARPEGKKISMIVACYRDNQAIPVMYERIVKVFEALKPRGYTYEIVFVNDCSPANDEEEIAKICARDVGVLGVSHSRNFGSQSAFLSGLEVCSGDAAVLMDGDLQDPPELIPDLIDKWEQGADIVYGQRVKRDAPLHMQLFYKVFYRVFRRMSDVSIPVDAGDFSLMNRKGIEHLLKFSERDVFLRGLRAWVGFKQVGVPYVRPERAFGRTTNSFFKNIWWAKKAIFSFSTKPLAYIQGLGLTIFMLTLLGGAFYFVNYFVNPPTGSAAGVTTLVLLILALGGLQLFGLSILGDYLGKVLEEVKARPRYIRSRIQRGSTVMQSEQEIAHFISSARQEAHGKHR